MVTKGSSIGPHLDATRERYRSIGIGPKPAIVDLVVQPRFGDSLQGEVDGVQQLRVVLMNPNPVLLHPDRFVKHRKRTVCFREAREDLIVLCVARDSPLTYGRHSNSLVAKLDNQVGFKRLTVACEPGAPVPNGVATPVHAHLLANQVSKGLHASLLYQKRLFRPEVGLAEVNLGVTLESVAHARHRHVDLPSQQVANPRQFVDLHFFQSDSQLFRQRFGDIDVEAHPAALPVYEAVWWVIDSDASAQDAALLDLFEQTALRFLSDSLSYQKGETHHEREPNDYRIFPWVGVSSSSSHAITSLRVSLLPMHHLSCLPHCELETVNERQSGTQIQRGRQNEYRKPVLVARRSL